jgi:chromosome segregation ATPase
MALPGSNDNEKLQNLVSRTYKEQAIWFLNANWDAFASKEAEKIWKFVKKSAQLDQEKKAEGNGLDEVQAHRFLESFGETVTIVDLRDGLRKTGAIGASERPKIVPLTHVLLYLYKNDWRKLVNTKGDNTAEIEEAQRLLNQVSAAFAESDRQAQLARKAEDEARTQEAPFKAAQEELEAAVADVKNQEDLFNNRAEELRKKGEEGTTVQQSKAKAELAQHLAQDPLPLRKAKVTLEAARKKAEKARAPFEAATKAAEAARAAAEEALEQTRKRVDEAEAYLEEVKAKPGTPHGAIWWLEEELKEQKSFLPERKGGVRKNL